MVYKNNSSDKPLKAGEPFSDYGTYSYADYLTWEIDEMVELIKGKVFRSAAAAPRRKHQKISLKLAAILLNFLENKPCQVYNAPFVVRLPIKSKKHDKIYTVVQPDICVICDPEKLDDLGCIGAPDLIIEILSPGNNQKELKNKYEVYEESGVLEYWIIQPEGHLLSIYTLVEGRYQPSRLFTHGDVVQSQCISGFELDLETLFSDLD